MVTNYSKRGDIYIISLESKGFCLAELFITIGVKSGLPVDYHAINHDLSFMNFRYWLSCQFALSFTEIKRRAGEHLDRLSFPELFL